MRTTDATNPQIPNFVWIFPRWRDKERSCNTQALAALIGESVDRYSMTGATISISCMQWRGGSGSSLVDTVIRTSEPQSEHR